MAEDGEQLVDENGDSIDKVREILFGAQQRKADQRFGILEKHIEREVRALDEKLEESKRGMDRRLSEMETKIVDEMKKLSQRLDDALTGFRKEADQTSAQLGERLSAAEAHHADQKCWADQDAEVQRFDADEHHRQTDVPEEEPHHDRHRQESQADGGIRAA